MTMRRAGALAFLLTAAAAVHPGRAAAQILQQPQPQYTAAQSFVPQAQYYLLTTDAFDARSLWVQPAGLTRRREASISALLTASHDSTTTVGQYGLTLASGGLGLGWQHDRLPNGGSVNAYAVGLAAGNPRVGIGADHRWYKGTNTHTGSWDIGGRYEALPTVELSLVWRDLGSPNINGGTINATMVPGAALQLFNAHAQIGADWEIVTHGWNTSAVRIGAGVKLPMHLMLNLRSEMDGSFNSRSFSIALGWNGNGARVVGFGTQQRGAAPDEVGLWGAAVSTPLQRRRRFGG
ncbi:MAG TPA: hypothetical protein VGI92_04365 [Gemmatimonadales bacterium]